MSFGNLEEFYDLNYEIYLDGCGNIMINNIMELKIEGFNIFFIVFIVEKFDIEMFFN